MIVREAVDGDILDLSGAPAPARPGLPAPGEDWPLGTHFFRIQTMEQTRALLGPRSDAVRRARNAVFQAELPNRARTKLKLGMHDRGEQYVWANGEFPEGDREGQARHFPLHLKVVRAKTLRIAAGEVLDLSATNDAWPTMSPREELYLLVRVDRLIVGSDAALDVHGNVFVLECGSIECADADARFEIRIRGTRHPAYSQVRVAQGLAGIAGTRGTPGRDSTATARVTTPFGSRLIAHSSDLDGGAGGVGSDGAPGGHGQNGGMAMLADIRIGAVEGFAPDSLTISAQAGTGEPGGAGGRGGTGGAGGCGADGHDGFAGVTRGGAGGQGGAGGRGGRGGRGGNGGLASHVFVLAPESAARVLKLEPRDSEGGPGGDGGRGGDGGSGGAHGALFEGASTPASSGTRGADGEAGGRGRSRAGPAMHLTIDPSH